VLLVITIVSVFISVCYLNSLYSSFNLAWGNVTLVDVLLRALPALGVVVVGLIYILTDPHFPWSVNPVELSTIRPLAILRTLLPVTALLALAAILLGKLRAWRIRHSRRRVEVHTENCMWHAVIIVAFGKDLLSLFDPESNSTVMLPWSEVKVIKGSVQSGRWSCRLRVKVPMKGNK